VAKEFDPRKNYFEDVALAVLYFFKQPIGEASFQLIVRQIKYLQFALVKEELGNISNGLACSHCNYVVQEP
jgi:hypothetical protein